MRTLHLELGPRSYPIYIGSGLIHRCELIRAHIKGQQVLVVSNEMIAPLYLDPVLAALQGLHYDSVILPDGEEHKNLETLNTLFTALLKRHCDRRTTLIALGGGVVGDIVGCAAALYQRGVPFLQIPTTLLAQVDSSVGGKTGVNHPLGKNMIGAFHQPSCVVADPDTLQTLPPRELSAGLAEVIKYGLIQDPEFFAWLEAHIGELLARAPSALAYAIERSCHTKAKIVALDERESGTRALLNLGHTFAHAIETGMEYKQWLHGEAVAAGMVLAADLSRRCGWLKHSDVDRIERLLEQANLPIRAPAEISNEHFIELMAVDKKALDGQLRLVLLRAIGEAWVTTNFHKRDLERTLALCRQVG